MVNLPFGANGTVYMGVNRVLYALNPNGSIIWNYTCNSTIDGAPTIGADGTIYLGNTGGYNVYAINPNGTLKWTYTTGNYIYGTPTIGADGTLYVACLDDKLYAINPNGTLKWTYTTGGALYCFGGGPAIGADGTIYFGSADDKLYAINPDGTLQWTYTTGSTLTGAPSIGADGTIYIGGDTDGKLYAINPNGTLKWTYTTGGDIHGTPSIGTDGTIYVGDIDDNLYAINGNGTLKWTYKTGNSIWGSAVIDADGNVYFGSTDDHIYALNSNGTLIWTYITGNSIYDTPSIGSDGTLYIESFDTKLYAFKDMLPAANFTASETSGGVPSTVQFTDKSLAASSWYWNFGDGTNSTLENPTHTYNTAGNYTVSLTAYNQLGNNTTTLSLTFTGLPPVANFTVNNTTATYPNPLTVQFTDKSQYATSWYWNFGDGTNSTLENPTHTYNALGNYTVSLTATNAYGNNTQVDNNLLQINNLITSYQGIYIEMSNHNGTEYSDGGPAGSYYFVSGGVTQHITTNTTTANNGQVTNTPSQSGTFYISTSGGRGSNDDLILVVAVKGPIASNFSLNIVSSGYTWPLGSPSINHYVTGINQTFTAADFLYGPQTTRPASTGMGVIYNGQNTSDPSTAEYLMFVDLYVGNINNAQGINGGAATVNYTFTNLTTRASFDVTAWASGYDAKWTNDPTASGYNVIPTPVANFTTSPTTGSAPLQVHFNDTTSNNPTSWYWNFGDGTNSTLENPTHTYNTPGTYTVALTATNADGTNTTSQTITVNWPTPVVNFTTNATSGTAPLNVQFNDQSTGNITSYAWNFGTDSNVDSTLQNPTYTYNTPGTYTVTEIVTGPVGTNNTTTTINVNWPTPTANFTTNTTTGTAPLQVQFNDKSNGNITSYNWNFGDGNTSTDENPTYSYNTPGTYTVTETVTGPGGTNNTTNTITVNWPTPTANFTTNTTNGTAPLQIQFNDNSNGNITSYNWNFGDGNTSTDENPTYSYNTPGTYTVTETVTGPGGTNNTTNTITVNWPTPTANFTTNTTNGTAPLQVQFNDNSTGNITSYNWNFGDGNTSTDENPTYTYNTPGTYTITETVTGPGGTNNTTNTITVNWPTPIVNFTTNTTTGTAPLNVQFNDQSTGNITSYAWNFGDGNTSTDENPTYSYNTPGTYTVTETVTGPGGTNNTTNTITVNWPTPIVNFTTNTTTGTAPLNVQFNDQSTGNITSYAWNFGTDSNVDSTLQNPTHTYNTPGTYTVTETVTGPGGTNNTTTTINVNYPTPTANFTTNTTTGTAPLNVQFNDKSTGKITSYAWNFGTDSNVDSTLQNPTHTYNTPGTYTVTETVTGPGGTNTTSSQIVVQNHVLPIVSADINGGLYNTNKIVTLAITGTGTIYYTTNGLTPTTKSTKYSGPITITSTTTLKFMAVDTEGYSSIVDNQTYIIDKTAPTAGANLNSGLYNTNKVVTLSMSEKGTIYYTTNGAMPTTASKKYTGPITITSTTNLKFIAVDLAGNKSPVYSKIYTIDKTAPKITSTIPINNANNVSLTSAITIKFSENLVKGANYSKFTSKT